MHRLPLILCLIAILGSAVSAFLFFEIGNSKQILEVRLADASARAGKLDADLAAANKQTGSLRARADALGSELTSAKTRATAAEAQAAAALAKASTAEARVVQFERTLGETKEVLAVYEMTARALADEVAVLHQDLSDTRSTHASPEAVVTYKSTIADLERQLATARDGAALPGVGTSTAVFASRAGRSSVLTVGPESAFVVLNFGSIRGAQLGQKLTVNQGPHVVATVLISDVRPNYSVAQVLPDTLRGVLQKGDSAVLIR